MASRPRRCSVSRQSCGVDVDQLEQLETDKGAWFVYRSVKPGQPIAALLPEIVAEALKALPIPKPMRWSDHDYSFVRPVHWLVMLHGSEIVDGEVLGLSSGRKSRGHRFMHPQPIHVAGCRQLGGCHARGQGAGRSGRAPPAHS